MLGIGMVMRGLEEPGMGILRRILEAFGIKVGEILKKELRRFVKKWWKRESQI